MGLRAFTETHATQAALGGLHSFVHVAARTNFFDPAGDHVRRNLKPFYICSAGKQTLVPGAANVAFPPILGVL